MQGRQEEWAADDNGQADIGADVTAGRLETLMNCEDAEERFIPPTPGLLLPYLAALCSARIPHTVEAWQQHTWHIVVPGLWADRARGELLAYERDNRDWPGVLGLDGGSGALAPGDLFGGAAVFVGLIVFFLRLGAATAGSPFFEAGALDTERVLVGEWWRTITALTLHADFPHVLGNAVCAVAFGVALSQLVGSGVAWLIMLLAGVLGNACEALVIGPGRLAVGASTATFGALGALGVLQTLRKWGGWRDARSVFSRTWIPVGAAGALLGWMGSGPRADIAGHVFGFCAGMLLALLVSPLLRRKAAWYWHLLAGSVATGALALAWHLALL